MSRTDKDRPWWVQNFQDGPELYDHKHQDGECIEESLELAKYFAGHSGWGYGRHHHAKCVKRVTVSYECTKADNKTKYIGPWGDRHMIRTCWTAVCVCSIPDAWRHEFHGCENRKRVACIGHTRTEYRSENPCVCDDFPMRPTCYRMKSDSNKGGYRRYTWGGVPSEFVRTYYHKPERARERGLDDMRREYNAHGDIEDYDFDNRQARSSARWLYW